MKQRSLVMSVLITVVVCFGAFAGVLAANWKPVLGLDLRGGLSIVYCPNAKGSQSVCAPSGQVSASKLNEVVDILQARVNALGVAQPNIGVQGPDVVVQLPGVKNANTIKNTIGSTAQLYFRKVLCFADPYAAPAKATSGSTTTTTTVPKAAKQPVSDGYVAPPVCPTSLTPSNSNSGPAPYPPLSSYKTNTPVQDADHPTGNVVLPIAGQSGLRAELGPVLATGSILSGAYAQDTTTGWQVVFSTTSAGSAIFQKNIVTPDYHYLIGADLDGIVESDPVMDISSYTGSGVINGNGINATTAGQLALLLKYGALPVGIHPLTTQVVSASLGASSLHAGLLAGLLGLLLVMGYTIFYYRALGVVVVLGLVSSAAILYAIISALGHKAGLTLDLSGITGLIVSVGITVDSYVVYFERLKDEVRAGRSIRSSVDKGFRSAYRTILSADAVSFIGAAVLYILSIGAVKGFALMLGISTLLDVITAFTFTRPLVILLGRNRIFTEARGLGVARGLGAAPAGEVG
ncbi:MAG: protein translocase subunit SecD [Acidimicrobiales bacterium]